MRTQKQIPPSSAARLATPFFKGGKSHESRCFSAPFEKGGGHCEAMAGDLLL